MSQNLTIKLNQTEMKRLSRLALRYGLSLPEFTRKVLAELDEAFPQESFGDYEDAEKLKSSFGRALSDWRAGRVQTRL
ncbi:MAG TPA: hypothetical protein VHE60_02870 [Pyrinomonadaceae bacterium]|nr:hypothetical protein [Pyrinomonadaceae bacterium]